QTPRHRPPNHPPRPHRPAHGRRARQDRLGDDPHEPEPEHLSDPAGGATGPHPSRRTLSAPAERHCHSSSGGPVRTRHHRRVHRRRGGDPVKRRLAAIGAVLVALLAGATGAAAGSYFTDAAPGSEVLLSGCVVRFSDPDGAPSIYANASHQSTGCTDVSITSAGRLRVTQTVTGATEHPIIFAFAQADETLSARGISCGASGGTDDTEYVCF